MPLQYFALDSTHGDFADAIAALPTASAQYLSYTPTLVQRAAAHDADIKIVAAVVEEADLTGDLEGLATINALCVARFVDVQELREFGFYMLDEPERSWNPKLVNGNIFITQGFEGGGGGGDGKTPFTAIDFFGLSAEYKNNSQHVLTGCIFFHQDGTYSSAQGPITFEDGIEGDECVIRCDYTAAPGVVSDHFYWTRSAFPGDVGQAAWVQDGTEPEVWSQSDYQSTAVGGPMQAFGGDFPILGTSTEWHDDWILSQAASLEDCRATPSTFFFDTTTIHVHLHDGASPGVTGRYIIRRSDGWRPKPWQTDAQMSTKIRLINMQAFGHDWVTPFLRGDASNYNADTVTFEGGRYIWSRGDWFCRGACAERQWVASTVGRILWDTSDRRNKPDSLGVSILKDPHSYSAPHETWGTAAAADAFNDWERHIEIGHCTIGPHPSPTAGTSQVADGLPVTFNGRGVYLHHIGEETKGFSRNNDDKHPLALRGGSEGQPTWREIYMYRVANAIYWYISSTAEGRAPVAGFGLASSLPDWLTEDIVIDTWNGEIPTAGTFGIRIGGDNDTLRQDDGTGVRRGIARRVVQVDFQPTGFTLGTSPSLEQGGGIYDANDHEAELTDFASVRSNWCFRIDRAGHVQALSSVQVIETGVGVTDITGDVISGVNTPSELTLDGDHIVAIGRQQGPFRSPNITLSTVGVGDAVIEWRYFNGTSIVAIPSVTDGTNSLKQNGAPSFTKPGDWVADTVGSRTCFHIYAVVVSGSFSTMPVMSAVTCVETGFHTKARNGIILEPEVGILWCRSGNWSHGAHVIDIDNLTIRPKSDQDPDTYGFFRFGSSGGMQTLAQFQANTKLAEDTDADFDSVFCPNVNLLEPLA